MDLMQCHYLQKFLYLKDGDRTALTEDSASIEEWKQWRCAILLETEPNFISDEKDPALEMQEELHAHFFSMQLNLHQQLLLFNSEYYDYRLVASRLYSFFMRKYQMKTYLAVGRVFTELEELPDVRADMEKLLEGRYYHPEDHILYHTEDFEPISTETMDSQLVNKISMDIRSKDVDALRKHFRTLKEKYERQTGSLMYVRFIFTSVLQDLYQDENFAAGSLNSEVAAVYSCSGLADVLRIVEKSVNRFCVYVEQDIVKARAKVLDVIDYIREHVADDMNAQFLGDMAGLHPGYLLSVLRRETGMNLHHLHYLIQMERAKKMLESTGLGIGEVGRAVGYAEEAAFVRAYQQQYGVSDLFEAGSGITA